ncbi:MAG: hypothetical protein ABI690_13540 [Chloroflexota bacterium]
MTLSFSLFEVILIATFLVYRITFMLNSEEGPGQVFRKFRQWVGVQYDEHNHPTATNWRAEAVLCFYCLSIWIGGATTLLIAGGLILSHVEITPFLIVALLMLPFALSGAAVFIYKLVG